MKLKLPSIHSLWISFLKVVHRFPLQVVTAIAATIAWCIIVDADKRIEEQLVVFLCVSNLALTLLLAADLYAEANGLNLAKQWGLRLVAVFTCTLLYFVLKPSFYLADVYRIGMMALAFHLLVAFAPFINKGTTNGFWQYNKSLFLRFLTSALYAVVLFAGLAIALVAIDGLFSVKISWRTYMRLFAIVTAGFTTIFFLAGIPTDFEELDKEESYPKGLKIFTQYVLIPLMTIYLLILLVYEAKIIINWELPKGLVSTLILGYAVFGILSLLLIHPIKEKEGNGWMKLFSRFFYIMMIPLVVLLLMAVGKRVGNYGITESRYILVILAAWLSLITIYFLFSKRQSIKVIPVSLCVLALLATYGPQSAFSVSKFSQISRLKRLMKSTDKKDVKQQGEVIDYLVDRHGLTAIQSFTKVDLSDLESKIELQDTTQSHYSIKSNKTDTAYALLKIKRIDYHSSYMDNRRFESETERVIDVKGYDYVIPVEAYLDKNTVKINNVPVVVEKVRQYGDLKLTVDKKTVEFNLRKMAKEAIAQFKTGKLKGESNDSGLSYLPPEALSLMHQVNNMEIKLVITTLNTTINVDDEEELNRWLSYNGYLLVRIK
jgi:hypothetical protein